jgi:hypothetical protein
MGGHILHDPQLKDANNPCGFCLNTAMLCTIRLIQSIKKGNKIDMINSHCPNLKKVSLATASKFTEKSPCTNIPLQCPLCPKVSNAVWKYNLCAHIRKHHPTADVANYEQLYAISASELTLMKGVYKRPPKSKKAKNATHVLAISEGHSSRLAMRYAILFEVNSVAH